MADLPCPFCGGTDLRLARHHLDPNAWFITCSGCECDGPTVEVSRSEEADVKALELWNKRTLGRAEYVPTKS